MDKQTLEAIGEFLNEELVKIEKRLAAKITAADPGGALLRSIDSLRIAHDLKVLRERARAVAHQRSHLTKHLGGSAPEYLRGLDA